MLFRSDTWEPLFRLGDSDSAFSDPPSFGLDTRRSICPYPYKPASREGLFGYICSHWHGHVMLAREHNDLYRLLETLFEKRYDMFKRLREVLWWEYSRIIRSGVEGPARVLLFAVVSGVSWIVERTINHCPSLINSTFGSGDSPLILTVENGNLDIINFLLDSGADPNLATDSYTPLVASVRATRNDILDILLQRGADVNGQTLVSHWTALHAAASHEYTNHVAALLHHGADPNAVDRWGRTPLHVAISSSDLETTQLLITSGGDPTLRDDDSETPLHWALEKQSKPLVEALLAGKASLSDIGTVSRLQAEWAASEPWYPELLLD